MLGKMESQILETFGKLIPILSEAQKNYLLGLGEGMVLMEERRKEKEGKENEQTTAIREY